MSEFYKNLTCICCPLGCGLTVNKNGSLYEVSGNGCERGRKYAVTECTAPVRTLTTTVRCSDGRLVPVRSETPLPKEKLMECMKYINSVTIGLPVKAGEKVVIDIAGTGIDMIATCDAG
ncbi:MAG: DUF1667 domain-containing protein [Firmicutes bacterium]|nr:DUF1667 domain-containing protein [Bacillota bacterium]